MSEMFPGWRHMGETADFQVQEYRTEVKQQHTRFDRYNVAKCVFQSNITVAEHQSITIFASVPCFHKYSAVPGRTVSNVTTAVWRLALGCYFPKHNTHHKALFPCMRTVLPSHPGERTEHHNGNRRLGGNSALHLPYMVLDTYA